MNLKRTLLTLALCLPFAACNQGKQNTTNLTATSFKELNNGNHQTAFYGFRAALEVMPVDDPLYVRCSLGAIEALVHVNAEEVQEQLLSLAQTSMEVGEREFCAVSMQLTSAGKCNEALAVLEAAKQRFGDSDRLRQTTGSVAKQARSQTEPSLDDLRGLGYLSER